MQGQAAAAKNSIVQALEDELDKKGSINFKDVSVAIPDEFQSPEMIQAVLIDLKSKGIALQDTVKDQIEDSKIDPDETLLIEDESLKTFDDMDEDEDLSKPAATAATTETDSSDDSDDEPSDDPETKQ